VYGSDRRPVAILGPVFRPKRGSDGRELLWLLRTVAQWRELSSKWPPYQTCHRRIQSWKRLRLLTRVLQKLTEDLSDCGRIQLLETFIDASFSSAKKRGAAVGPTRRGKGSKITAIADRHGLPVACCIDPASPNETRLVEATDGQRFTQSKSERMVGDSAYNSDPLDRQLREKHRIRWIAPHKSNRRRENIQNARGLRRNRRLWRVERLVASFHIFRRQVTCWNTGNPTSWVCFNSVASSSA
jgi:transposase